MTHYTGDENAYPRDLARGMSPDGCYANALITPAMVAIVVAAVVLVPTMIIPVRATAVILVATIMFLVTRNVLVVVPVVLHKEDPLAAGVVLAAVLAPVFGMARRHAQINRRTVGRHPLYGDRLRIKHLRLGVAADVEAAIEARLADAERQANVGSECRNGSGGRDYSRCDQKTFHLESPVIKAWDGR